MPMKMELLRNILIIPDSTNRRFYFAATAGNPGTYVPQNSFFWCVLRDQKRIVP
jgi:hypothetical protein